MHTENEETGTILVAGGTGKTGRRVVAELGQRGLPVRVGSRTGSPPFDWQDPHTWDGALSGARAVYLAYHPDLAAPGAEEMVGAFVDRAVAHGVQRLVLLSGRGEPDGQRCEKRVTAQPWEWTIVRAAVFNQNFSESFLRDAVVGGEVALPAGDVAEPFVDAEDIAAVAATALTDPGHAGHIYEVTGPRLLTLAEAVAEIAAVTGREVRYTAVTPPQYTEMLTTDAGMPEAEAGFLADLFAAIFDGRNATVSEDVSRVLGRAPRDFDAYVRAAAAAGAWG